MKKITIILCAISACVASDISDDLKENQEIIQRPASVLDLDRNEIIFSDYVKALIEARIQYKIKKTKSED